MPNNKYHIVTFPPEQPDEPDINPPSSRIEDVSNNMKSEMVYQVFTMVNSVTLMLFAIGLLAIGIVLMKQSCRSKDYPKI